MQKRKAMKFSFPSSVVSLLKHVLSPLLCFPPCMLCYNIKSCRTLETLEHATILLICHVLCRFVLILEERWEISGIIIVISSNFCNSFLKLLLSPPDLNHFGAFFTLSSLCISFVDSITIYQISFPIFCSSLCVTAEVWHF